MKPKRFLATEYDPFGGSGDIIVGRADTLVELAKILNDRSTDPACVEVLDVFAGLYVNIIDCGDLRGAWKEKKA